jgi:hypothetical protein
MLTSPLLVASKDPIVSAFARCLSLMALAHDQDVVSSAARETDVAKER